MPKPCFSARSLWMAIWTARSYHRAAAFAVVCQLLACLLASTTAVNAQPGPAESSPQDEARSALLREGIKPFAEIMAIARARVAGDFVKIELKRKKHGWEYKVRILTPQGRRREMKIDAMSGEVIEIQ